MKTRTNVAILISGRGSNMEALVRAAQNPNYPARIATVVADNPDAEGLFRAFNLGVITRVVNRSTCLNRAEFETALTHYLANVDTHVVCLAGFMSILSDRFLAMWPGRVLNIHPSLLPKYPGLNTHARALADGATVHGCSVHEVTSKLDGGPVIGQLQVPVLEDDTEESLAGRVLEAEHILYPEALAKFLDSRGF